MYYHMAVMVVMVVMVAMAVMVVMVVGGIDEGIVDGK